VEAILTIIIQGAPYGGEHAWNALRLAAASVSVAVRMKVNLFLIGDGVALAKKGQRTPEGYYNLENMLQDLIKVSVEVRACGTCLNARGLSKEELIDGVQVGTMTGLAKWVKASHNVLSF
jgi:uncharacterized protein involved in oxidation of intracellular sulfur